jgi:uncharacterized protein (DUF2062 family)
LKYRFQARIKDLLRQGLTPRELALSVAAGCAVGLFPILGTTTILSALLAVRFRLNIPVMQLVNQLVFSLQLALFIPFLRLGEWVYGAEALRLSPSEMQQLLLQSPLHGVTNLADLLAHAVTGWALVVPPTVYAVYRILNAVFSKLAERHRNIERLAA